MFAHKLFCPQLNLLQYTCSLAQDGCRAMLKEVQHKVWWQQKLYKPVDDTSPNQCGWLALPTSSL